MLHEKNIHSIHELKHINEKKVAALESTADDEEKTALENCFKDIDMPIDQSLKGYLKSLGLDAKKWEKVLNEYQLTEKVHLQYVGETKYKTIISKEQNNKNIEKWEMKALCKAFGMKSDQTLYSHLQSHGLNPEKWTKKLEEHNITKLVHLKCDKKRFMKITTPEQGEEIENWEIEILRKCFDMPKKTYEQVDLEKVKTVVKDFAKETEDRHTQNREFMEKKMQASIEWEGQGMETKQEVLNKIKDPESEVREAVNRECLSNKDLIQNISAGLILKGYYISKDMQTSIRCKQTLLQPPENTETGLPSNPETSAEEEHYSKDQEDSFHHALKHGGHSIAVSAGGGGWGFHASVSAGDKKSTSKDEQSIEQKNEMYVGKTKYLVVPTASFSLSKDDYQLTPAAVKALQDVELLRNNGYKDYIVKRRCEAFFNTFGSHYYTGTYHFGGIYQWNATFKSEGSETKTEAMKMVQTEIDASVSAGYKGFGFAGEVSTQASKNDGTSEDKKSKKSKENSNVITNTTKYGGPQEVDCVPEWKKGLVSSNSTWTVIDRGDLSLGNYRGVWNLIKAISNCFKNPVALAVTLKEAWESLTELYDETDDFTYIELLEKVKTQLLSFGDNTSEIDLEDILTNLEQIAEKINLKFESNDIWALTVKNCSAKSGISLKDVLHRILDKNSSAINKFLAKKLLIRAGKSYEVAENIKMFIGKCEDGYLRLTDTNPCDIKLSKEARKNVTEYITTTLAAVSSEDPLQFIFLTTVLKPLTFSFTPVAFKRGLTESNLLSLINASRICLSDFETFIFSLGGIIDTIPCIDCLQRLIKCAEIAEKCEELEGYLKKDTRVHDFVDVVEKAMPLMKDDKKCSATELLLDLKDKLMRTEGKRPLSI